MRSSLVRVLLAALIIVFLLWLVPQVLVWIGLVLSTIIVYIILFVVVALVLGAVFGARDRHW